MRAILAFMLLYSTAFAQPNVVLVILDDISSDQILNVAEMPNFSRLANGGAFYPTANVPCLCRPSLATLLSGKRVEEHGVHGNFGGSSLPSAGTLSVALDNAGYRTRQDGKFWEGDPASFGFDEHGTFTDNWGNAEFGRRHQVDTIRFIRDAVDASEPFFLWWAPQMPHTPHTPPVEFANLFQNPTVPGWFTGNQSLYQSYQQDFLAMTYWADAEIGRLMGELALLGELDNTLIVVLTDNGYEVGAASKLSPFERGMTTPLIFHYPNVLNPIQLTRVPDTRDIAPTILNLCGVTIPPQMTGDVLDLADIVTLPNQFGHSWQQNQGTWTSQAVSRYCRTQDGWKYIKWLKNVSPSQSYGMHEPHLATVPTRAAGDEDLFYIPTDPRETTNLAASNPTKLAELRDATEDWYQAVSGQTPPPSSGTIIDDGDSGFVKVGEWTYAPNPNHPGEYGDDVEYSAAGNGSDYAEWNFAVDPSKTYEVAACWNAFSNRATDAPYTLYDNTTSLGTVDINQELAPNDFTDAGVSWERLGNFQATSGILVIRLTDDADEYVMADAIRIMEVP